MWLERLRAKSGFPPTRALRQPTMPYGRPFPLRTIRVEIAPPSRFLALEPEWRDLVSRAAEPNAFMEPALVAAAARHDHARVHVLLAWSSGHAGGAPRLEGAWALLACRSSLLPLCVLKSPVHEHGCLGTPVLDAENAAKILTEMLDAVKAAPDLPDLIEVSSFSRSPAMTRSFDEALAACRGRSFVLEARSRPELHKEDGAPRLSRSRLKALRQRRRRLDDIGETTTTVHQEAEAVRGSLEELLNLEAAGWKGSRARRGRAILRDPSHTAFFRAAVCTLAEQGLAMVTALRLGQRPVAMQLTIRSGRTLFTWKSAYDEELRASAPGILLLQDVTDAILSDPDVLRADSCNHRDDGYMAEFWPRRRDVAEVFLDVGGGMGATFLWLRLAETARARAKAAARRTARALAGLSHAPWLRGSGARFRPSLPSRHPNGADIA